MAARSKMVKSTIRIKILTKSRKTSSNLGWEQKQGLQRAISSTLASHFPKPHLPEAPPGPWTRSFSGPHPGHPPPAPLCAPPPSSHWRPKTCALLRYPPKAGNVAPPRHDLGERWNPDSPTPNTAPTQGAAAMEAVSPTPACLRQKIKSGWCLAIVHALAGHRKLRELPPDL